MPYRISVPTLGGIIPFNDFDMIVMPDSFGRCWSVDNEAYTCPIRDSGAIYYITMDDLNEICSIHGCGLLPFEVD